MWMHQQCAVNSWLLTSSYDGAKTKTWPEKMMFEKKIVGKSQQKEKEKHHQIFYLRKVQLFSEKPSSCCPATKTLIAVHWPPPAAAATYPPNCSLSAFQLHYLVPLLTERWLSVWLFKLTGPIITPLSSAELSGTPCSHAKPAGVQK